MLYPVIKALHLIAMVAWFAGLFYLPRILIYSVEARAKPAGECDVLCAQLEVMGRRLWRGITWPAMVATLTFGVWLVILRSAWAEPWLWLKAALVACLVAYHFKCGSLRRQIAARRATWTAHGLRLWNEVATVLLVGIVLVASLKSAALSWVTAAAVAAVVAALFIGVHIYRWLRNGLRPLQRR